jgi:hypothetical protein
MRPGSPAAVSIATPATTHPAGPPEASTTCRYVSMKPDAHGPHLGPDPRVAAGWLGIDGHAHTGADVVDAARRELAGG